MNRILYLALTSLFVFSFLSCKPHLTPGVDVDHATLVTFNHLRDLTKDEKSFWWLGGDAEFQYFRTKDGFYRMTTSSEHMHEGYIRNAKQKFDRGVKIGESSQLVKTRGDYVGLPEKENRGEPPYRPLDPVK